MMIGIIVMGICALLFLLVVMAMRQRAFEQSREHEEAALDGDHQLLSQGLVAAAFPVVPSRPRPEFSGEQQALALARVTAERRAWELALYLAREDHPHEQSAPTRR